MSKMLIILMCILGVVYKISYGVDYGRSFVALNGQVGSRMQYQDSLTIYLYKNINAETDERNTERLTYNEAGALTHIAKVGQPRMIVYKPEHPTGHMVLICPGGAYTHLNVQNPRTIADQLVKFGLTVFVLVYRLPADQTVPLTEHFEALHDVRAGLEIMEKKAEEWGYQDGKIVLWGSSAGAHLASLATTNLDYQNENGCFVKQPDYLVLTFPVTSLHSLSTRTLLFGNHPTAEIIHQFSPYKLVNENTPKTFLVHASDDSSVSPLNSLQFYEALHRSKVSAELHIYSTGGHGFGFEMTDENSWMNPLIFWFSNNDLIE